MRKIIIGTRESKLAVIQTKWVVEEWKKKGITNEIEIKYISTRGDRKQNVSLAKVGGTGIFIQDIEDALERKEIDVAVHSLKDLPVELDRRFMIAAIPEREDHRDAFIGRNQTSIHQLTPGAVIGTSSARRAAQIKALYPEVKTQWIRGAVDGRLKQLREGKYDGIILAVAGLNRLGLSDVITDYLPTKDFVPAAGQGALAIECRSDDEEVQQLLKSMNDPDTEMAILTERAFVHQLDKEDKAPIGAYAYVEDGDIHLYTSISSLDGKNMLSYQAKGKTVLDVSIEAATHLLEQGAGRLIEDAKMEIDKE